MPQSGSSIGKSISIGAGVVIVALVGIQLVPYGRDHTNPPVVTQTNWNSPQTRDLFNRACADCHSNETTWPWYSNIAPVSWLVQRDVNEGRQAFNVSAPTEGGEGNEMGESSEGSRGGEGEDSLAELIRSGEMPMSIYLLMHPTAKLADSEKQQLIDGLSATFGGEAGAATRLLARVP